MSYHTIKNVGPLVSLLRSRSIIRFTGPDTIKFLQGLLTNDVRKLGEPPAESASSLPTPNLPFVSTPPVYSALLTPQGRFLYDFFLYRSPRAGEGLDRAGRVPGSQSDVPIELLADVDASQIDELLQTFRRYRLRSKVEIEDVTGDFSCWQRFGGCLAEKSRDVEEPEAASIGCGPSINLSAMLASRGSELGWQWLKDPRLDLLGSRALFPSSITPPLIEADKITDEENYLAWRAEVGVAEGSNEIPRGEAVPLEYNLAGLNAISFTKGCYVGQEFIARTHHGGVIRKRLVPLVFHNNNGKVCAGLEVLDSTSGKKVGVVRTAIGDRGMGLLRLLDAFKENTSLAISQQEDVKVDAIVPAWWPPDWLPHSFG